ncbi:MAG: Brp/Blh family beta-carotene 15,15'-dioxygenase [Bacteroidota bacterium]
MRKVSFLLFCSMFAGLSIWLEFSSLSFSTQLFWSILLIMLLGIPHGAIDHVISREKNENFSTLEFYTFYFGMMAVYLLAWIYFSSLSLIFFLVMSAFHFGQSQFSDLEKITSNESRFISLAWGISVITGLLTYNYAEVIGIFQSSEDLKEIVLIFDKNVITTLLTISSLTAVVSILWLGYSKKISVDRMTIEMLTLILIHTCFYTLPIIIGFTIYFTTIHSLTVMSEEYSFLKMRRNNFSVVKFINLLLPFSLLSIFGSILIVIISSYGALGVSNVLLIFILLSIVTLPHSIVMDGFYDKFYNKNSPTP